MIGVEPITMFHLDPDKYETRAELVYPDSVLNEMARRVGDKLDEEILARLGYVKPVRCKECKRVTIDQGDHDYREPLWCDLFHPDVSLDGYCAWGKRKKEHE